MKVGPVLLFWSCCHWRPVWRKQEMGVTQTTWLEMMLYFKIYQFVIYYWACNARWFHISEAKGSVKWLKRAWKFVKESEKTWSGFHSCKCKSHNHILNLFHLLLHISTKPTPTGWHWDLRLDHLFIINSLICITGFWQMQIWSCCKLHLCRKGLAVFSFSW